MGLWPWSLIFKTICWKSRTTGIAGSIDRECKGCESIEYGTDLLALNLDLDLSRSYFEKKWYFTSKRVDWHKTKGMWVDRMLDPSCDFELWPGTRNFKVKFWKSHIPGMGGQIDMEWKGCESIGSQAHFVTWNFDLTYELDLGFSRSNFEKAVSLEWGGWLTWNKGDWVNRKAILWLCMLTPPVT